MSEAGDNKKPSFLQRLLRRGRELLRLGSVLVNEPRAFPREFAALLRRFLRTIWEARGGGFYACGVAVTFIGLEVRTLASDVIGAESVSSFVGEQIVETIFRFLGESIVNGWLALIWPVYVIDWQPPWGIAALAVAYGVFALFLKAPLERWIRGEQGAPPQP